MSCNGYKPYFQKQLNPNDPMGGFNCTCYSGAMAAQYHTCGTKFITGERVRYLTGDRSGGTALPQVDYALNKVGVHLDTHVGSQRVTWEQFVARLNAGQGAIVQGGYNAIYQTRFSGSETFKGNHAIYVNPGFIGMDPLADGRRTGIYKYHGEKYPPYLIKNFAAQLVKVPNTNQKVGYGLVWCAFTRDNWAAVPPVIKTNRVHIPAGTFIRYYSRNGVIVKHTKHRTGGFSAYATATRTLPAIRSLPYDSRTCVWITSGAYKGWLIGSRYVV
jgi:hypothetical protein